MAAYCQVYDVIHFTSPAGRLPVHRDQLRAQRSVKNIWENVTFLVSIRTVSGRSARLTHDSRTYRRGPTRRWSCSVPVWRARSARWCWARWSGSATTRRPAGSAARRTETTRCSSGSATPTSRSAATSCRSHPTSPGQSWTAMIPAHRPAPSHCKHTNTPLWRSFSSNDFEK